MADIVRPGALAGGPLNASAMPANMDLDIYKGDYVEVIVPITDSLGNPVDLTGMTPKAQLKYNYQDQSPIDFDCTVSNAAAGEVRMFLSSEISATLIPGSYIYDLQVTGPVGTRTYIVGDVNVQDDVTK